LVACDNLKERAGPSSIETTTIPAVTYDAVYVVNGEAATISVIDAEKNVVAETITVRGAAYPRHITVSPDRSVLGVAVPGYDMSAGQSGHEQHSSRPGAVLVIDALTGALVAAKETNAANQNVAFSPDGNAVWTSQATTPGSTLVLDRKSLVVSDSISVGTSPAETVVAADGYAYVANNGSASVSVIDVPGRTIKATVKVGAGPVTAQPGPGRMVYVLNEVDQTISVIDASTLQVANVIPLGFQPGTIVPTNNELWISAPGRGGVEVRDERGGILRFIQTGRGAHGIAFSSDGARAYVSNQLDDTVSVVDRATSAATMKINVGARPNGLAWRSR
jgi:YVTN family beta-propeller protein